MAAATSTAAAAKRGRRADADAAAEAGWRERALNAEEALSASTAEIRTQRDRTGQLLGQIRDMQDEATEQSVQRIATENGTLKQRIRQLTQDNRGLERNCRLPDPTTVSSTGESPTSKPSSSNDQTARRPEITTARWLSTATQHCEGLTIARLLRAPDLRITVKAPTRSKNLGNR
ncbi:hypothetical protein AB0H37_43800 [Actinomadura sp. NPDC023710]|uniref:hypothetical protein n=1 Tax=Actinomadura sp. NPDC023710 TaxID=3158219 RepID=UPI0033CB2D32